MNSKKNLIISMTISTLLLFGFGITYARFTYNRTGLNNKLILGDIYMHYKETNSINMEGAMPQSVYVVNTSEDAVNACVNYLYTTYGNSWNDIEYGEASGVHNKYKNLLPSFIARRPTYREFCNESDFFLDFINSNRFSMDDLIYFEENNILINTITNSSYFEFTIDGKNTYEKEDIGYEIVLIHGDNHATRTERIQDNLLKFRLVEVVNGVEKVLITNKSYLDLTSKIIWSDTIPANTTSEIEKTYRLYMWISNETIIGNTSDSNYDMNTWSNQVYASIKVNVTGDLIAYEDKYDVTDASCFTTEVSPDYIHNSNITDAEVSLCANYLTSIWGVEEEGNTVDTGETYESFCRGTGTNWGLTFQELLGYDLFSNEDYIYFSENNIIISQGESITITDYDTSCGSDVVIPKTINGYNVTRISNPAFSKKQLTSVTIPSSVTYIGAFTFSDNKLTSVTIPSSVTYIGDFAFSDNKLTSVTIPSSVTYILASAFRHNQLTSVTIENGVKEIYWGAFIENQLTSVVIPDSVTYLSCEAFDNNVTITKKDDLVCTEDAYYEN